MTTCRRRRTDDFRVRYPAQRGHQRRRPPRLHRRRRHDLGSTALVFTAITANGTLSAAAFRAGAAAADADDRIIYNPPTGDIFYDPDGNGGAAQILFATVANGTALTRLGFRRLHRVIVPPAGRPVPSPRCHLAGLPDPVFQRYNHVDGGRQTMSLRARHPGTDPASSKRMYRCRAKRRCERRLRRREETHAPRPELSRRHLFHRGRRHKGKQHDRRSAAPTARSSGRSNIRPIAALPRHRAGREFRLQHRRLSRHLRRHRRQSGQCGGHARVRSSSGHPQ